MFEITGKYNKANIYATTVDNASYADESPMAYRRIDEILDTIEPTADV